MRASTTIARGTSQAGFTLVELLVAIAILGMVMAAVLGVYVTSQSAYLRATSLEAAQEESRVGIDRMASDIRLIGAYYSTLPTIAITGASATTVSFLGDVNGDTVDSSGNEKTLSAAVVAGATSITVSSTTGRDGSNPFAAGKYVYIANGSTSEAKQIASTYTSGTSIPLTAGLTNSYPSGSIVRTVESVTYTFNAGSNAVTRSEEAGAAVTVVGNATALTLSYFDANGNGLGASPTISSIREIGISLTTQGTDKSQRVMSTRVSLRNLP